MRTEHPQSTCVFCVWHRHIHHLNYGTAITKIREKQILFFIRNKLLVSEAYESWDRAKVANIVGDLNSIFFIRIEENHKYMQHDVTDIENGHTRQNFLRFFISITHNYNIEI